MKQFKKILLIVGFLCGVGHVFAQGRHLSGDPTRKKFDQLLKETNLQFTFPSGFSVIPPVDNDDFSYDFAMELPGHDFEVWIQVQSARQNWFSYEKARHDNTQKELANPDSMYVDMSRATAAALSGDNGDNNIL